MATPGETSYQGGVGGKFRENSNRRDSRKPYSRPPDAIRNTSAVKKTSWKPSLVENASRIVTESAHKLFSSVFRKNLPAIMNSEANHDLGDAFLEEVPYNDSTDQELVNDGREELNNNSNGGALNDLEQILKQKTFTRAEIDRLTELLRSRTSDVSVVDEQRRFETGTSQLVEALGRKGSAPNQGKEVKSQTLLGPLSAPMGSVSFVEEDVASPTEIAKAYMGSRSSKLTPLPLSLRNQAFREDLSLQNGVPYTPKPHSMSPVPRASVPYASLPKGSENGYLTPVPRGRYTIYSMVRTPYSRVHHSAMLRTEGKAGPSISSQRSLEKKLFSGGRQAFKRRSSDLDSELGSIGPIRRTRRKTNMISPTERTGVPIPSASLSTPFTPSGLDALKHPISSVQKQFHLDGHMHNTSARGIGENGENSIASKRFACVPNQSRETALKILEQLEKFVPSPKGKSCVMEASSSELMPGDKHYSSPHISSSPKQTSIDENGLTGISLSGDKLGSKANGIVTTSTKDTISSLKNTNAVVFYTVENAPQKKQLCEKNANKDSLELEDNHFSRQIGSNPAFTGKEKHDRPVVENKEISSGAVGSLSDSRNLGSFMLKKVCDAEASNNYPASEKGIGGTYPVTNAIGTVAEPAPSTSLSPSLCNGTSSSNGLTGVKFSLASKTLDKTATCESSDLNGARSEVKPKTMSSAATPSSGESHRSGNFENVKDDNLFRHLDHTVSSKSMSTAPGTFSFGASTSSILSNGSPASLPVSDRSTSNVPVATPSSTTVPVTTATPSIPVTSVFQFGSSTSVPAAPSNSASLPPVTSATSVSGGLNSSPFGIKTSALPGSSSGVFIFGASTSSAVNLSSFNSQVQSSSTPASASSQSFGLSGPSPNSSGGSVFGSSPGSNLFPSGSISSLSSSTAVPASPTFSLQATTLSIFGSQLGSTFSTTGFNFGSSSAASTTTTTGGSAPMAFGSSVGNSSGSIFSFTSAASVTAGPASPFPAFTTTGPFTLVGSASPGNDHMNIEDSMTKDQASTLPGESSNFAFGAPSSSGPPNMFQFSSQQNPATSQAQSPFQASGSLGFSAGGNFSVGTGGTDKSNRRFIKVRRDKTRRS